MLQKPASGPVSPAMVAAEDASAAAMRAYEVGESDENSDVYLRVEAPPGVKICSGEKGRNS